MSFAQFLKRGTAAVIALLLTHSANADVSVNPAPEMDARTTIACLVRVWLTELNEGNQSEKPKLFEIRIAGRDRKSTELPDIDNFSSKSMQRIHERHENWTCGNIDLDHYNQITQNPIIDVEQQYGKREKYEETRCDIDVPTQYQDLITIDYSCGDHFISPTKTIEGRKCGGDQIVSDLTSAAALFRRRQDGWTYLGSERFGEADMAAAICPSD